MSPLLLDELRHQWPPPEPPDSAAGAGYMLIPLDSLRLLDACELPGTDGQRQHRLVVAIAGDEADRLVLAPLIEEGGRWRRARPGDGLSRALVEALRGRGRGRGQAGRRLPAVAPCGHPFARRRA